MRRDLQQCVPFPHRLLDQAEFAVFQVADAAVDHVRGGTRGTLAVVAALHQRHVDALQRQVAKGRHSIDATAHDEHLGSGPGAQCRQLGSVGRCGFHGGAILRCCNGRKACFTWSSRHYRGAGAGA